MLQSIAGETRPHRPLFQRRVGLRALSWVCAAALLLSLLPLFGLSLFNHACYDDYGFSLRTHAAWRQTGSLLATVAAAAENTRGIRYTWQGTYTSSFVSALQPALFGESLYWLSTAFLLTLLLFSLWFFLRQALLRALGADRDAFRIVYCLTALVMVQFVPDVSEAFFWYNGGVAYTMVWSLMLLRLGSWFAFERSARAGRWLWFALTACLTVLLGGGTYGTLLFAALVDLLLLARAMLIRRKDRIAEAALTLGLLACFAYSASAPGNLVRAATLSGAVSAPKAVAQALYFGTALMGSWCSLAMLALWFAAAWLMRDALRRSSLSFRYPGWVTALGVGLFCAQLAPTLYTGIYLGDGRSMNAYYFTCVLMGGALSLYWMGWGLRRWDAKPRPAAPQDGPAPGLRLTAVCACAALMLAGCLAYKPEGKTYYGPQNTASGSALLSLATGQAQAYDAAMDARDRQFNDAAQTDLILTPVQDVPDAFMSDVTVGVQTEYVQGLYAEYYGKHSVVFQDEQP